MIEPLGYSIKNASIDAGVFMYRMYGMARVHGCTRAAMYRMYGMARVHGCTRTTIFEPFDSS